MNSASKQRRPANDPLQNRRHSCGRVSKRYVVAVIVALIVAGCGGLQRNPVPIDQINNAAVLDLPQVRSWGGTFSPAFQADLIQSVRDEPPGYFPRNPDGSLAYNALALSGGGANGAFGTGVLCGWTDAGTRPDFKLVTGISTGALMAPFAFLGSDYDAPIKKFYVGVSTKDVLQFKGVFNIIKGESLADSSPLVRLIHSLVDEDFLKAVAGAHAMGKRLYIGTTHLDADRLVIWNMGIIAGSGHPEALSLFRAIMLASASIPGVFPPVYVPVEVDGRRYDEMHVDGGVKTQVFFYGSALNMPDAIKAISGGKPLEDHSTLFVIRNGKLAPEPKTIPRKGLAIMGRAIDSMIKTSAQNDLIRLYAIAKRDKLSFFYIGLPGNVEIESKEAFDRDAMKKMFDLGYRMAKSGDAWHEGLPRAD